MPASAAGFGEVRRSFSEGGYWHSWAGGGEGWGAADLQVVDFFSNLLVPPISWHDARRGCGGDVAREIEHLRCDRVGAPLDQMATDSPELPLSHP